MFKLEKLEIHGFKSFADKINLVFGEGVTGIVGPNGCGKSNVSEAISWVLGEQSAKSLRGGKMEDVIFNGTRDRKPQGMAEVILTLVAKQDILSRDAEEDPHGDEAEYQEALQTAERAAAIAKTLVAEYTPKEEAPQAEPPVQAGDANQPDLSPQASAPSQTTGEQPEVDQASQSIDASAAVGESQTSPLALPDHQPAIEDGDSEVKAQASTDETINPITAEASEPESSFPALEGVAGETEAITATDNPTAQADKADKKPKLKPRKRKTISVMAGERITIGRRLYRTGDSDYLMNGRLCLLRDIQDLFAGTGLGGAHYAIIEQGRIGQILSSKPLDRRALIEEAAGITKFKSRKRTTELRLESAKQNLTRLNDIISEVERQVNSLKRQAQKARRYKRLREEMRALQFSVYTADYYRLNEAAEKLLGDLEAAEQNQQQLDAALSGLETEYRVVSSESRTAEDQLTQLKEEAATVELEADRVRNRRAFESKQIAELTERIEKLKHEQQELENRLAQIETNTEQRLLTLQALEEEHASTQADLRSHESEHQAEVSKLREAENGIEVVRQQLLREIGSSERLKNLNANLEDGLRRTDLRLTSLNNEMDKATRRRDEVSSEYVRVGDEVEGGRLHLAELTTTIAERNAALNELKNKANAHSSELSTVRSEIAAAEHRLKSLEDLDSHHAYYSDAVQQILSPEQRAKMNALGTLADFVEVEPQYEKLVESLFSRELQCVLVPTIDDALAGVEFIKTEGLSRGAFLVVGLHGGEDDSSENPESRVWSLESDGNNNDDDDANDNHNKIEDEETESTSYSADDNQMDEDHRFQTPDSRLQAAIFDLEVLSAVELLGLRPEIKAVVERAFPERCAASVVPDMEAALHLSIENPSRVYVTLEGEQVVNGRLIVTGGQAGQKGTSLLGLKREIKQLRVQTQILHEEASRVTADLSETQRLFDEIEQQKIALDGELREKEKEAAARDSHFAGLAKELERAEQYVRVVESEIEQTEGEREDLESRISELAVELQAAEEARRGAEQAVTAAQEAFLAMRADVEDFAERLSSMRAEVAARAERLQAARAEMRRLENEAQELHARINRNRAEMYESHNRIDDLSSSHSEGENAALRYEEARAVLAEQIENATNLLMTARAKSDELEKTLSELRQNATLARDQRSQTEIELTRVKSNAEHLARTCFSELAMTLEEVLAKQEAGISSQEAGVEDSETVESSISASQDEVVQQPENGEPASDNGLTATEEQPFDLETARARLDELRIKLDDIGPVNMMALEELEEADERFKFLSEQRRDILESIRLTEEALDEIKRRSRERFRHAFAHINENFQKMFVELFGGGRGEMILIDEDDVLESGIDIIAQPPGKRLQNVMLLSGGEKAMSAISLVLAIFQYKPSPFCILDEVDAPLDEMNVGRFANKVGEMSKDTQFLVITHNKTTMEAAQALYGVTMEEPGISKLVSVKFE
jgi:chromosome segregation protein